MPTALVEIFRDSKTHHRLSLFDLPNLKAIEALLFEKNSKPYIKCLATDKDRPAKPEEIVRQLWIYKLINQYGYPKSRIAVEHPVAFGSETKRADIVVFDKDRETVLYIIVELKKTKLKEGKDQLKSYCNASRFTTSRLATSRRTARPPATSSPARERPAERRGLSSPAKFYRLRW